MYNDGYSTAIPDHLVTAAVERVIQALRDDVSGDVEAEASCAVEALFCPCVCHGACACGDPTVLARMVVEVVVSRARAELSSRVWKD